MQERRLRRYGVCAHTGKGDAREIRADARIFDAIGRNLPFLR
jgi:hypothetical protein